jgi:hypothetical protein
MYSSLINVKFIRNFKTLHQNSPWATKESIFHSIFLLYNQRMCILTITSFITIVPTYIVWVISSLIITFNINYQIPSQIPDNLCYL